LDSRGVEFWLLSEGKLGYSARGAHECDTRTFES